VSSDKPMVSIIIPVYNEEACLPALFERLEQWLGGVEGFDTEILFVDDHSADATPTLLAEACEQRSTWRFLRLATNSGSHIAIFAGLEHTQGDCAVFLAADLQDPPELISDMVARWQEGQQVVWAVREKRDGVPASEMLFANTFYWLMNRFSFITVPPKGSDFALLDQRVIQALRTSMSASPYLMGEIARLGFAQAKLFYTKSERVSGETKWNLSRKLQLVADAFTGFSFVPIRLMSYLGMAASVLGLLYALVVILNKMIIGGPVDGWSSLMVVVLLMGGFQMTMLGVLGEYLWRTLEESRQRPKYFIESAGNVAPPKPLGEQNE
jgi:polyisoprenyl-phosphate glycosyltransferase